MGNQQPVAIEETRPEQFVTQAHMDWVKQMQEMYNTRPTLTKTVILPPGVDLNDPRLAEGVVVAERKYQLDGGQYPIWPEDQPFECDVDGRLLPPCWGREHVYPNRYFPELHCGYCDLHRLAQQEPTAEAMLRVEQPVPELESRKGKQDDGHAETQRQTTEETREPIDVLSSASPDLQPLKDT